MQVLLTGASGVLGSQVLKLLQAELDCRFLAVSREPKRLAEDLGPQVEVVQADLRLPQWGLANLENLLQGVSHILHLAADVRWNLSDREALQANTETTRALVHYAKNFAPNLQRFVYVSTAFVDKVAHPHWGDIAETCRLAA